MKLVKTDRTLYVTDGLDRGPLTMVRLRHHPTRPLLFGQCVDRRLAAWDLNAEPEKAKGRKEPEIVGQLVCPHELGWIRGFDVHPDGDLVVTGGSDRRLRFWPVEEGRPADAPSRDVAAHDGWVEAVAFSPNGEFVATAGADRVAKVWSVTDGRPIATLSGHTGFLRDLAWSRDGRRLFTGAEDGLVFEWDSTTWKQTRQIEFGESNDQQGQNPSLSGVHGLSVSRDDRWLAVAGGKSTTTVFDLATGVAVATESVGHDVLFHAERDLLVSGESTTRAWAYDASKLVPPKMDSKGRVAKLGGIPGQKVAEIKRGEYSLGLDFAPDGKTLAVGKSDGSVELWDLQT